MAHGIIPRLRPIRLSGIPFVKSVSLQGRVIPRDVENSRPAVIVRECFAWCEGQTQRNSVADSTVWMGEDDRHDVRLCARVIFFSRVFFCVWCGLRGKVT